MAKKKIRKVVLAYSGGLDTSVMTLWLKENYDCEVIAFTADLGQGEELEGLREKALKTGASKIFIEDLRETFVRDYVFPAIKSNALYEGYYLMGTALARPCIARKMVEIARAEGADAVSHGATGKGNDQVRFELTAYALYPEIKVIAPWRVWTMKSRDDLMEYAAQHGIPVTTTRAKPYSMDRNMMHISYEGGILEDPWNQPPKEMFLTTVAPEEAPDKATSLEIEFEDGSPVAVDGVKMSPATLLAHLNKIGGDNGVGRVDLVENRYVGIKSRGVYETPGGTILHTAHRAVESITLDRETLRLRDSLVPKFTELVYYGYWYSPEMQHLLGFMDEIQKGVTGTARIKLYKGSCTTAGRKSPYSLYSQEYATFGPEDVYDQKDAEGFIKINALRLKLFAMRKRALAARDPKQMGGAGELREGFIE